MRILSSTLIAIGCALAQASPALAMQIYSTPQQATDNCRPNEVVSVDNDRHLYYFPAQPEYGRELNGGFGCFSAARQEYAHGGFLSRQAMAPAQTAKAANGSSGSSSPPASHPHRN